MAKTGKEKPVNGERGERRIQLPPGVELPATMSVETRHPLPPDVSRAIELAKRDGGFFIAVVRQVGENGELEMNCCRDAAFNPDHLMRGWQEVARKIVDGSLAGTPIVPGTKGG
jgi:hypothetical protein